MTDKHIDLIETLNREVKGGGYKEGIFPMRGSEFDNDRRAVLRWLDAHPDQVPGRTITKSELGRAADNLLMSEAAGEFSSGVRRLALELGITVAPDPEPTNAEKLATDLSGYGVGRGVSIRALSEHLAERGWTKAGGDES
ncbi:hypothetical protein [Brevibacterium sp. SMBL_HHYL_HB1]|uniref:hypothetical protein n=1 Tax=Brevibacterium sp. SMBL_HHYL_HB1 TaxID=2777556 RepID=UPI001BA69CB0|nr:hypothetical protein [Brevibacterium sp. SMBL_HHYL_HB1]QUL79906.1 hypothetical protein IG171_03395 [Brevibacterium sp. SMBL_HHYL_HB1]